MPFKSRAQLKKFAILLKQGKISIKTFERWIRETPNLKKLPQKVSNKKNKNAKKKNRK